MRIRRVLIANRGEIACRIARTAGRMGLGTVAVYSAADRGALHVAACDQAVEIGPAPAAESYLRGDRIIEAAQATGADAIHPGYGFLSENPGFAEAVEAAGLTWIGPPAQAIRAMGLKDAAKRLMEAAGVPVTPGYHGAEQDPGFLAERAAEIGYPVLIKASAGGGGKGMRRVDRPEDFTDALARAQSEAERSFANPHVLIEKFVLNPRHIEVQVFADSHGNTVHLFERDCSAQRRHQKVIEEAPAPGITPALRAAMTEAAVAAARAVGYRGAGTVEFIVDGGRMAPDGFFFMEMNTRLQVEHPVTEAVTGLDLVEWQIRVSGGEALPLTQDQIGLSGHAIEARIYAEDPARGFVPQTGTLQALAFAPGAPSATGYRPPGIPAPVTGGPDGGQAPVLDTPGLRVDTGIAAGLAVTPFYDPMIAKLIAHGPDRGAAFDRLVAGLAATHVAGVTTNVPFLTRLAQDEDVLSGALDTGLIDRRLEALNAPPPLTARDLAIAAACLTGLAEPQPLAGWRSWGTGRTHVVLLADGERHPVALTLGGAGLTADTPLGEVSLRLERLSDTQWQIEEAGRRSRLNIFQTGETVTLSSTAGRLTFALDDPTARTGSTAGGGDTVTAPLPGLVRQISVAPGQDVRLGQAVAVIEAMKMEHSLTAPRDGQIAEITAQEGEQVAEGAVLVRLAEEPAG